MGSWTLGSVGSAECGTFGSTAAVYAYRSTSGHTSSALTVEASLELRFLSLSRVASATCPICPVASVTCPVGVSEASAS